MPLSSYESGVVIADENGMANVGGDANVGSDANDGDDPKTGWAAIGGGIGIPAPMLVSVTAKLLLPGARLARGRTIGADVDGDGRSSPQRSGSHEEGGDVPAAGDLVLESAEAIDDFGAGDNAV